MDATAKRRRASAPDDWHPRTAKNGIFPMFPPLRLRVPGPAENEPHSGPGRQRQSKNSEEKTMKTPNFRRHRVAAAVAGAVLALGATQALATGFQLNEQSASSIGNAFAGGAAFTDDISAMWWNPAVLSKFERRQFIQGLHVVVPKIEFSNDGSVPATQSAARRQRRGCRRLELHPEPVLQHADQRPVRVRAGHQRPVRQQDPVQRRLARPLPGARLEDHHDQRQPGDSRGRSRPSSRSAPA